MFGNKKPSEKKPTDDELDEIAGRAISPMGLYTWNDVYREFVKAGLSEEDARLETDKRVWSMS